MNDVPTTVPNKHHNSYRTRAIILHVMATVCDSIVETEASLANVREANQHEFHTLHQSYSPTGSLCLFEYRSFHVCVFLFLRCYLSVT